MNDSISSSKYSNFKLELLAGSKLTYDRQPNKKERKQLKRAANEQAKQRIITTDNDEEEKKREHKERVQQLRKYNRIFTWGSNIPDPIDDFSALRLLSDQLRKNINHFTEPTPVQMQSIPLGLQHRDLLVSAPTGSGKTLAFAIPVIMRALQHNFQSHKHNGTTSTLLTNASVAQIPCASTLSAIVIEPTKVLAKQTYENFRNFCTGLNLNCVYLRGTEIDKLANILICTPNRLIYALERLKETDAKQFLVTLQWLIVDECDRIFDRTEGENSFRIQLAKILDLCNGPETRRGFFSATFSSEVEQWCKEHLQNVAMLCIGPRNSANELVQQELLFVGWEQAKVFTVRDIIQQGFSPPALIFLQSKDRAKQLYIELCESCKNIPIGLISGDLTEEECELVVDRFRQGAIWLLICTEMLGRGLDFKDVNLVINFDLPTSIVSYIHRIGRTGRAGRLGRAITLFTEADMPIIRPIATVIQQTGFSVPEYLLKLHKPTREERKKLHKNAPHRKNLVAQWGRLKHRIQSSGILPTKNGKKKHKPSKDNKKGDKEKRIGNKRRTSTNDTKKPQIGNDTEQGWQIVGPSRSKRRRKQVPLQVDAEKNK